MQRYAIVLAVLATVLTWLIPVGSGVGEADEPEAPVMSRDIGLPTLPLLEACPETIDRLDPLTADLGAEVDACLDVHQRAELAARPKP